MNKPIYELKLRDGLKYQTYLSSLGLSSSAIKFKRSSVSSLCGFIEIFYNDEYPLFRSIFNKNIPNPPSVKKKEVVVLSKEEVEKISSVLESKKEWQKLALFKTLYSTGCRRAEVIQLKTEIINYPKSKNKDGEEQNFYVSHFVRGKGRSTEGKPIKLLIGDDAMESIKKWLKERDDDCEYIFTRKTKDGHAQINVNTINNWVDEFGEIIGRKIHPHSIRKSRSTHIVVDDGLDIKVASKLLNHADSSTTDKFYVIRDDEDEYGDIF
jgi:integrase